VGIIRVVTSEDEEFLRGHARALEARFGFPTATRCISDQPHGIHDDASMAVAVPKIVRVAQDLVTQDGADLILISCAADPGIAEVRAAVGVPVVGAGSAAATLALMSSDAVGVLGITPDVPEVVAAILGSRLVAARVPRGVRRTNDLLTKDGMRAAMEAGRDLCDAGATSILFACTGFTTIGLASRIAQQLSVPVVDAVLAAGLAATYVIDSTVAHLVTATSRP
jgi:Asp/Glu/hydantoin racemase